MSETAAPPNVGKIVEIKGVVIDAVFQAPDEAVYGDVSKATIQKPAVASKPAPRGKK